MDTLDRVVTLEVLSANELGDLCPYRLILEVMGKHSNLILVDEKGTVIDAAKRVYADMSRVRTVLPGDDYLPPPSQARTLPSPWTSPPTWQRIPNRASGPQQP